MSIRDASPPAEALTPVAAPLPRRRALDRPLIGLVLALCVAAAAFAIVGTRVTAWELDETAYHMSAVHYTSGLPGSFFHDLTAWATSRLYALTLAPLFALTTGDVGIRVAKVYNAVLWCSTAVPLYLLARPVLSGWRRSAAVALGVVTPWMALTTLLFTESLALPAFVWFTYFALRAVRDPRWWRDAIVLAAFVVAITSRVQLAGVLPGYILLIALAAPLRAEDRQAPLWWRMRRLGLYARSFSLTLGAIAAVALYAVYIRLAGRWDQEFIQLFGPYAPTKDRATLVSDGSPMVLIEVLAISCGVGLVAMCFAVPWYCRTLAGRVRDERWWYAAATACTAGGLLAFTAYAQGSYWGPITEERYWFYAVPFVWVAAFVAAQTRQVRARDVAVVAGAVALLAGAFEWPRGLDNTSAVLAPVIALLHTLSLHSLKPLTAGSRDVTALMVIAVGLVAYLVLRRAPWLRPEWLLGGGAVLQLALTVLPLVAITGHLGYGVNRTGGDFATLAWIDRHTSGPVTWLPSEPRIGDFGYMQRNALFWNDEIRTRTIITESTPQPDSERLNALPTKVVGVDDATGAMSAPPPSPFVIAATNSPYQQPAGAVVAHSPAGDLQLVRMPEPRLVFRSKGLGPADEVTPASRVRLLFWPGQAAGFDVGVTLHGGKLPAVVQAGGQRVDVPAGATVPLRFGVCGARPVVPVVVTGVATPADALVSLDEVALRPRTSCT